jgi:hypothetical protein
MAIVINYAGASLRKPGAYSRLRVAEGGAAQAQLGVVAIIGEADQGDPLSSESGLSSVTFSPSQFTAIQDKYVTGPLVDAARLAITPSIDPQIVGGAQQLLVLKTNQSLKSSISLATSYGTLDAQVAGAQGNNISAEISDTGGVAEVTSITCVADIAGSLNDTYFFLNSPTTAYYVWFDVAAGGTDPLIPGRTAIPVALGSGDVDTAVALATASAIDGIGDFNVPVPSTADIVVTNASVGSVVDAADSTAAPTGFTIPDPTTQGVNTKKVIEISDAVTGVSELSEATGGTEVMTIQVTDGSATAATLTIDATEISTTVTGGTAASLSIPIAQFNTIGQLVEYINTQSGYSAAVATATEQNSPPSVMDYQTAVPILANPYGVLRDAQDIADFFSESGLVDFTVGSAGTSGLPDALTKTFLTGGAKGGTTNANILAALDELLKVRVNFVIPEFSRDASDDISDNLTDAASTYTIDAIHVALRTHVVQASDVKGRKERQGYASYKGTLADTYEKSANLGSSRVSLCFQDVDVLDSLGELITAQPHMLSTINAGMKAAAVIGLPNTFKLANINGFTHTEFDPEVDADDGIDNNLSFVEKAPGGGFRWVLDNSTYGLTKDAWIYNRPSVLYAADTAAFSIRLNVETFVGQRNSDISQTTVQNLLISVMDGLRTSGIIVPDVKSLGKGYKDLAVNFEGSIIRTSVTLVLVEGYEFALNDITVTRAVA